jgi:hypothetical protein
MRPIPSSYPEIIDMQRLFAKMGPLLSSRAKKEYCLAVVWSIYGLHPEVASGLYHKQPRFPRFLPVSVLINPVRQEVHETKYTLVIHMDDDGHLEEWYNGPTELLSPRHGYGLAPDKELPFPSIPLSPVNAPRRYLTERGADGGNNGNDGGAGTDGGGNGPGGGGGNGPGGGDGGGFGAGGQDGEGAGRGGLIEVLQHPVLFSISPSAYDALLANT